MYSRDGALSDETPILQNAAAPPKSGLRNYLADDSSEYEGMMMQPSKNHEGRF